MAALTGADLARGLRMVRGVESNCVSKTDWMGRGELGALGEDIPAVFGFGFGFVEMLCRFKNSSFVSIFGTGDDC